MTFLSEIAHLRKWVGWREEIRNGLKTKVPYDPVTGSKAESNNSSTWASRGEAENWAANNRGNGIGLMFSPIEGGLHTGGIDLDTCRCSKSGAIEPWAQEVIARFQTYTEISPSQTGGKAFF